MRRAMYEAEVGDDVYGEDPTVKLLEAEAAARLGHEAGLFMPSGTQSNLVALLTHCGRGDEYIVGARAHTYWYEGGGAAALGGIQPQTLPFAADGSLDLATVATLIKPDDPHFARTRLVCLENTQAGKAIGPDYFAAARACCDTHGLALHLDGARVFNAAVALDCPVTAIAAPCDTVSVCLSKGLGAPVGSVLVGSRAFVGAARRWRKMVGGGMRQAGVIAAAGLYALRHNVARLAEDHANAARLAELAAVRFPGAVRQATNMVFVDLPEAELVALGAHLRAADVIVRGNRWVLHKDVSAADVERVGRALDAFTFRAA
ncbi:MAG: low-specificity L-threonine aldolase [Pseudomonadales bacterium]|nr:low-specificity L-threonine aldolase [Pseudomonadales bacterium]